MRGLHEAWSGRVHGAKRAQTRHNSAVLLFIKIAIINMRSYIINVASNFGDGSTSFSAFMPSNGVQYQHVLCHFLSYVTRVYHPFFRTETMSNHDVLNLSTN